MAKPDRLVRCLVHDCIEARKRTGSLSAGGVDFGPFTVSDFRLAMTRQPIASLEDLAEAGQVWIIGLAADDLTLSRGLAFERVVPVQIAVQKLLAGNPAELEKTIDRYEDLEDELRDCARLAAHGHPHVKWLKSEPLKDENGTPFFYQGLREANTFEAIFTAFYKVGLK